jgi:hypothetical protein
LLKGNLMVPADPLLIVSREVGAGASDRLGEIEQATGRLRMTK